MAHLRPALFVLPQSLRSRAVLLLALLAIPFVGCAEEIQRVEPPRLSGLSLDPCVTASIEAAHSAVRNSPQDGALWGRLGMHFDAHDLLEQAVDCYAQAARLDPENPRWGVFRVLCRPDASPEERIAAFEASLQCNASHLPTRLRLAMDLVQIERSAEARSHIDQLLQQEPVPAAVYWLRARIALAAGDAAGARKDLETAVAREPTHREALALLARVAREAGDHQAAEMAANKAAALSGSMRLKDPWRAEVSALRADQDTRIARGKEALRAGQFARAREEFGAVLKHHPKRRGELLAELGHLAFAAGRTAEAFAEWEAALDQDAAHPEALVAYAEAKLQAGRTDEALARLTAAGPKRFSLYGAITLEAQALVSANRVLEAQRFLQARAADRTIDLRSRIYLAHLLATSEDPAMRDGHLAAALVAELPVPEDLMARARHYELAAMAKAAAHRFDEANAALGQGVAALQAAGASDEQRRLLRLFTLRRQCYERGELGLNLR